MKRISFVSKKVEKCRAKSNIKNQKKCSKI